MRKKWVVCMIACLTILLAGCNGNTAKETARNDTDKRISSTAGNTETTTETEKADDTTSVVPETEQPESSEATTELSQQEKSDVFSTADSKTETAKSYESVQVTKKPDSTQEQKQPQQQPKSKIMSYYNSMVSSVQKHTVVPSFCTKSSGSAKVNELEWNGSKYVATLTDSNGVLSNYDFKASISGVTFSTSGNKLTVSMDKAPSKEFTITASKKNGVRRGVVVWSEGKHSQNSSVQDVVTYAQEVSDPVSGYVKMKVSYGSCQIVKTSEDGKVDGINFTITGNGVNQTVKGC